MAQGFAPAAVIEPPPRVDYEFGVFSVVPFAEHTTERWINGVQWEALACDNTSYVVGECDSPQNWPTTWPGNPGIATAAAFTEIGLYSCSPDGSGIDRANEKAQQILQAREQYLTEKRLWEALALNPTIVTGTDYAIILGTLEQWLADHYGSKGVLHCSRLAAESLGQQNAIKAVGNQLQTHLGTPVIAGGGYPGTGARTTEVQTVTVTGAPTGGTFTLTLGAYGTTAAIAYNASAQDIADALNALAGVSGVTAGGGPEPGSAVTVTFGGEGFVGTDVPQMTGSASFTGGTTPALAVTTTTAGGDPAPAAGHQWVAASPAIFGYRSPDYYDFTSNPGDLLDRSNNNLYGMSARDYLLGWEPCGVAFADFTLGAK